MNKLFFILSVGLLSLTSLHGFIRTHDVTNFYRPSDKAAQLPLTEGNRLHLGSRFEYGRTRRGNDFCGTSRNILQIHDPVESALHMIERPTNCVNEQLTLPGGGNINDFLQTVPRDGVRGTQCLSGRFTGWDLTLFGSYTILVNKIPGSFLFSAHVPLRHREVGEIAIVDRTSTDTTLATSPFDELTKEFVTDQLCNNVSKWGCLDLSSWEKTGFGDLVLLLEWVGNFPQDKESLKEVSLSARVGVSIPTGEAKDINRAFAMPMGNDSAWGVPFGISLGLNFFNKLRTGIDADLLALFDTRRERRLKTVKEQTEHLLLNKGIALKAYGLTWQFHMYVQAYHIWKGFSASVAYDYVKHDGDRLIPKTNQFDTTIVNTANSLEEWNAHNFIFKVNYDFTNKSSIEPQLELFYKLPISGKNVIDPETFGAQIGINF